MPIIASGELSGNNLNIDGYVKNLGLYLFILVVDQELDSISENNLNIMIDSDLSIPSGEGALYQYLRIYRAMTTENIAPLITIAGPNGTQGNYILFEIQSTFALTSLTAMKINNLLP